MDGRPSSFHLPSTYQEFLSQQRRLGLLSQDAFMGERESFDTLNTPPHNLLEEDGQYENTEEFLQSATTICPDLSELSVQQHTDRPPLTPQTNTSVATDDVVEVIEVTAEDQPPPCLDTEVTIYQIHFPEKFTPTSDDQSGSTTTTHIIHHTPRDFDFLMDERRLLREQFTERVNQITKEHNVFMEQMHTSHLQREELVDSEIDQALFIKFQATGVSWFNKSLPCSYNVYSCHFLFRCMFTA